MRRVASQAIRPNTPSGPKELPTRTIDGPRNRKAERKLLGFSRCEGHPGGRVLLLLDRGFDHGLAIEHLDAKVDSFAGVFGSQASFGCAQRTRQRLDRYVHFVLVETPAHPLKFLIQPIYPFVGDVLSCVRLCDHSGGALTFELWRRTARERGCRRNTAADLLDVVVRDGPKTDTAGRRSAWLWCRCTSCGDR